jgi:hypothetical protein
MLRLVNNAELFQPASPGPCANPNQPRDRAFFTLVAVGLPPTPYCRGRTLKHR